MAGEKKIKRIIIGKQTTQQTIASDMCSAQVYQKSIVSIVGKTDQIINSLY